MVAKLSYQCGTVSNRGRRGRKNKTIVSRGSRSLFKGYFKGFWCTVMPFQIIEAMFGPPGSRKRKDSGVADSKWDLCQVKQPFTFQERAPLILCSLWKILVEAYFVPVPAHISELLAGFLTWSFCWNLRQRTMKGLGGAPALTGASDLWMCSRSRLPWKTKRCRQKGYGSFVLGVFLKPVDA